MLKPSARLDVTADTPSLHFKKKKREVQLNRQENLKWPLTSLLAYNGVACSLLLPLLLVQRLEADGEDPESCLTRTSRCVGRAWQRYVQRGRLSASTPCQRADCREPRRGIDRKHPDKCDRRLMGIRLHHKHLYLGVGWHEVSTLTTSGVSHLLRDYTESVAVIFLFIKVLK